MRHFESVWAAICLVTVGTLTRAEEQADFSGFYVIPAVGISIMDSRLPVRSGAVCAFRLGYDINEPFAVELSTAWHPTHGEEGKRLNAFRGTLEGLYHFTRWERLDPFLSLGGGILYADKDVLGAGRAVGILSCGGGTFYHLSEHVALRGDVAALATTYRGLCAVTGNFGISLSF